MEILKETAQVRVSHVPGTPADFSPVVAFTGIGDGLGGLQKEEFWATLSDKNLQRELYFVIDKKKSWYNSSTQQILPFLRETLKGRNVVTLGNSMGGFGAVLFSQLMQNTKVCIAFAPQFSVDRALVPFEKRWSDLTENISQWRYPTCILGSNMRCKYLLIFGASDERDMAHARLFRKYLGDKAFIYGIKDSAHDVARKLRSAGVLGPLVLSAVDGLDNDIVLRELLDGGKVGFDDVV